MSNNTKPTLFVEYPDPLEDAAFVLKALPMLFMPDLIDLKQYWFEKWNFETGDPVAYEVYLKVCSAIETHPPSIDIQYVPPIYHGKNHSSPND